jgi:ParB-like chromosome segregation protein Spo0J
MKGDGAKEEALTELRNDGRPIIHTKIIAEDDQHGKFQIYDGSHRAVVLGIRGSSEIECYVASNE